MTDIPHLSADLFAPYLARRRWYQGKDHDPQLAHCATGMSLRSKDKNATIHVLVLADIAADRPTHYQVPVVVRRRPLADLTDALIAEVAPPPGAGADTGPRYVYDAVYDPAFAPALLAELVGAPTGDVTAARVMSAEQSNTSLVVDMSDGERLIVKLFRVLNPGENPDVVVQGALGEAGCPYVPAPKGYLAGGWQQLNVDGSAGERVSGHLAVAQEFLPDVTDAWSEALASLTDGRDFTEAARDLGTATAEVHRVLADVMPTHRATDDVRTALTDSWRERLAQAIDAVPELAEHEAAAEEIFAAAASGRWPRLQRIHGDYHLGQVLNVPGRGWVLLDFEGEPLRPLTERTQPDLPLRDIAGMLRSFDYAAGSVPNANDDAWAAAARVAFLAGYCEHSECDPDDYPELLRALELDKALYEAVYEARNRPDWLALPVAGISRLCAGDATANQDAAGRPRPDKRWETNTMNAEPLPVSHDYLAAVARGLHHDPHSILGAHEHDGAITIRTLRHLASSVEIVTEDASYPARHEHDGIWVAVLPVAEVPDYRVRVSYGGESHLLDDPYRFWPTFGELDGHLLAAGRHEDLWRVLGAHVRRFPSALGDVEGVSFTVWAPSARAVRVKGDMNSWDGTQHAMRSLGSSGVWELFIPGARTGQCYKFEIWSEGGGWLEKADPMARGTQIPPATASVVVESAYEWNDDAWLARRAETDPHSGPMSIYEVHLGSWRAGLSYRALAHELTEYVTSLGFTHVEFMPIAEHPFGGSWGYQVTSYYAPTARLGSPDDFKYLVDCLHQAGIGVIVDWVPAHFPKDSWALARFDGTPLYEDPNPLRGEHPDWGTLVFNFGRNEVRNFLVANALYWLEEFHIDALRVDAVASMLYLDYSREDGAWQPNIYGGRENLEAIQFLQEANATAYRRNPGIAMIAEESTSWPGVTAPTDAGGLGFGLKWNMGWMNDTLRYMAEAPINRRYHHGMLTFSLVYAFSEQFVLPFSHDEVVHGKGSLKRKMPGDWWQQLAGVRALLAYQWSHPGKQLLFMGQEFAQDSEWTESQSLDWWLLDNPTHAGVAELVRTMNELYREHPALYSEDFSHRGFEWIQADDADHNVLSFLRRSADGEDVIACIINFAGTPHENYRIGLPQGGDWLELLNTDSELYGGSGVGNLGRVSAEEIPWDGREHSVRLRIPPLGALWLSPAKD
ncbi:1,4-alpha-glucan branching protein GlgB [Bowdeniella nasicola]